VPQTPPRSKTFVIVDDDSDASEADRVATPPPPHQRVVSIEPESDVSDSDRPPTPSFNSALQETLPEVDFFTRHSGIERHRLQRIAANQGTEFPFYSQVTGRYSQYTNVINTVPFAITQHCIVDSGKVVTVKHVPWTRLECDFHACDDVMAAPRCSERLHRCDSTGRFAPEQASFLRVLETAADHNFFYVVSEYVDGLTLDQYIKEHPDLSFQQRVSIASQLVRAVQFMHSRGLVHRDLAADNIMIDTDGRVRIIDYGLMKSVDRDTDREYELPNAKSCCRSPEVLLYHGYCPKKLDMFCLSAVLVHLFSGSPLYRARRAGDDTEIYSLYSAFMQNALDRSDGSLVTLLTLHGMCDEMNRFSCEQLLQLLQEAQY
jgi:hypothetical protein